jgi:uncharacterized membrane protein
MNDLQNWEMLRDKFQIEDIKMTLTLASGTFVVSLAFLAKDQVFSYKIFLLISWVSLVLSIIMGMWAMTAGVTRYDRAIRGKRGSLKKKEEKLYKQGKVLTPLEKYTPSVQKWSYTVGLLSFFLFVIVNVYNHIKW